MSQIRLAEGTVPSAPGGASRVLFASSDGIYALDSAGGTTKFGAAGAGGGIAASGGTQVVTSGTLVFSNSNGLTFGISNSSVLTASHNGLTTAAASNHSHGNPTLNLTNLSGTTASNSAGFTLSLSAAAGGGGADGYNILAAGTQTAATTGTVVFSNSNGITFGMSNSSIITASHNGLTTQTVQTQSNVQGLSAGTQVGRTGDIVFADSNGISFGLSGSTRITATYTVPSIAGLLSAVNVSAGTTSNNLSALTFSNSNGLTFGLNGSVVTASHNGLTTARASNDGVGLATALTAGPLAWTVNSAGISLNASSAAGTSTGFAGNLLSASMTNNSAGLNLSMSHPAWLTTAAASNHSHGNPQLNLTNLSGTTASNSAGFTLSLSAAAGGGGADGYNILAAGTQTAATTGTVAFVNSNGISFGMSNSSQITASYTVPSTAGLLSAINVSAGTTNNNLSALTFNNANGITFGLNASTITASHNGLTSQSNQAVSGSNGSFTWQTVTFGNLNGLSFYTSNGSMVGSHDGLTSQSNQAFSAAGGSSTFQTLGFADSNGVSFSNSNGSVVATVRTDYASSLHSHGATLFAASNTTQSSSGTVNISSIVFAGAGIASVGVTNGSVVVSVPSGGGAGDGVNILAAGTRTATTAGTVLFSNANGVTFGLDAVNGSVMTASVAAGGGGGATVSFWANLDYMLGSTSATMAAATSRNTPVMVDGYLSFNVHRQFSSVSFGSTTIASTANTTYSYNYQQTDNLVIYSRGTGASSFSLLSVLSDSESWRMSVQVGRNSTNNITVTHGVTYPVSGGTSSFSTSYGATVATDNVSTTHLTALAGIKQVDHPLTGSLTPGQYWFMSGLSTAATTNGVANLSVARMAMSEIGGTMPFAVLGPFGGVGNNTVMWMPAHGSFSSAGGATTANLDISKVSSFSNLNFVPYIQLLNLA